MGTRVLIVDDEPLILQSTKLLLQRLDYEVLVAARGGEALRLLRTTPIDVVLVDLRMPDCTGEEVIRQIREDPALGGVRIMLFSANLDAPLIAERLGVTYLEKPFAPGHLHHALEGDGRAVETPPAAALARRAS